MQSFRFPFSETPLEMLEEINYLEETVMSFAEEFRRDRERLKEKFLSASNVIIAQGAVLDEIVLKEFTRWHKVATTATHFRVTFHYDVNGMITYNTRLNGEYNLKDPIVKDISKDILSAAVMLIEDCKDDPLEAWADCILAREEYDTEGERYVYTFEFCGNSKKRVF